MKDVFSLIELNGIVRALVETAMPDSYWVEAELSEVRESRGHCYMELIQKEDGSNTPVARAKASCWRNVWGILRPNFERVTGQRLAAGMKVLMQVHANFHENYGFSWIVDDIDATFTLGDMARRRREIIRQLRENGVLGLNKELPIPMFAQSIAVVSSATAAGFGDFCHELEHNKYGFFFSVKLFNAKMQGEQTESSVINALDQINRSAELFDCVVIIRGGGATSDLSGFDTFNLANNVAQFPLPVITGIGHERDESVLDIVANTSVKTPTAAAEFLIANLAAVSDHLDTARRRISEIAASRLAAENMRLQQLSSSIPMVFTLYSERQQAALSILYERLRTATSQRTEHEKHRLEMLTRSLTSSIQRITADASHRLDMLSQRAAALEPSRVLRRGYSITTLNGRAVKSADQLSAGDVIVTRLSKGKVASTVKASAARHSANNKERTE